ncbi:flavodoxin family protein [Kribbella sp. NPDC002412]
MSEATRALIVYESMYGNTEKIATAIRDGLRRTLPTETVPAYRAPEEIPGDVRLLVVGGPTHAFSMSRASTRRDARNQHEVVMPVEAGIREWLETLADGKRLDAATFDTRITKVRRLPGSAAKSAAKVLRHHGFKLLTAPASFYLDETTGPIGADEIERARAWGEELGRMVSGSVTAS